MKKLLLLVVCLLTTIGASAQFEEGKFIVNTSITGLDLSYSSGSKGHFGFEVGGGYFLQDNWAVLADLGGDWSSPVDKYKLAAKTRYYFDNIGIYLSGGLQLSSIQYKHMDKTNDFAFLLEAGYAYFLSKTVTIEPAVYWDLSVKDSDNSKIGLKIGFSFYF
ncbi:hypothetical protein Bcop_2381 [Bacteroides coprosuis DSM 18011]|uniref:Outer membrane protein beta-barrel domain-containing protein n=1 Tax=Bacteroides coprosuis DSM 18011 TaxID=679937 RepID=F3ZNJ9_9BACE|nr:MULTISPECIES: outer membrane beta-barrel protein [Bacteroides]EGJ72534.1 hypothetical protein Bcop_2381 [Bacteroides coprosuis DSM 18011]HJD93224.1 porin family protein [Bacteroides coprosuis]